MLNIIEMLTSNNAYLAIAIVISIFIIYSFIKKIIKLVFVGLAILTLYVSYLHFSGDNSSAIVDSVAKVAVDVKSVVSDEIDKIKETASDKIDTEVSKQTDKLFNID